MVGLRFGPSVGGGAWDKVSTEVYSQNEICHHPDIRCKRSRALGKPRSAQGLPR